MAIGLHAKHSDYYIDNAAIYAITGSLDLIYQSKCSLGTVKGQ